MKNIKLHKPSIDELWFREKCMSDSDIMSYNAGYDINYNGYHKDSGCVDFPQDKWQDWVESKLNNPNFFYAYILDIETGQFVGYVNFDLNPTKKSNNGNCYKK